MLRESPQQRPNIYQVIREVCLIRGTDIPIKDVSISLCPGQIIAHSSRYMLAGQIPRPDVPNIYPPPN